MPPVIGELDATVIASATALYLRCGRGSAPLSTNPPRRRSGSARSCMRTSKYTQARTVLGLRSARPQERISSTRFNA